MAEAAPLPKGSGGDMSMPVKVLAVFNANPTRVFEASEIARLIGDDDMHLIRSTLFRLAKTNKIRKLDRGKYGAMQTHKPEVAA